MISKKQKLNWNKVLLRHFLKNKNITRLLIDNCTFEKQHLLKLVDLPFKYHIENAPEDATYLSSTTVTEIIDIIAKNIENNLRRSLRNASYFTLLADESTDEQNREQLSIYARWTSPSSKPIDHFLGIVNVQHTNAESLLNAIQGFLVAKGLDIAKCRFVGFDGANVMSGEVSGES